MDQYYQKPIGGRDSSKAAIKAAFIQAIKDDHASRNTDSEPYIAILEGFDSSTKLSGSTRSSSRKSCPKELVAEWATQKHLAPPVVMPKSCLKAAGSSRSRPSGRCISFAGDNAETEKGKAKIGTCIITGKVVINAPREDPPKSKGKILRNQLKVAANNAVRAAGDAYGEICSYQFPHAVSDLDRQRFALEDRVTAIRHRKARDNQVKANEQAIHNGHADFCMHVMHSSRALDHLKLVVDDLTDTKVGSYVGWEREHARWGGYKPQLPTDRYLDPASALSSKHNKPRSSS